MKSTHGRHFLVLSDTEASGEWIATVNLFRALSEQHLASADLVAFDSSDSRKKLSAVFERVSLVPHIKTHSPFRLIKYLVGNLVNIRKAILQVVSTENRYDGIVVTHYLLYFGYLFSRKLRYGEKTLFIFQGIRNFDRPKPWDFYGWVLYFLEWLAWTLADVMIIPAQENITTVYQKMGFWGRNKVVFVLPNIIPTQFVNIFPKEKTTAWRRKYGIPAEASVILFSGRIAVSKGVYDLVKAFSAYHRINPQSFLILAYPKSQLNHDLLDILRKEVVNMKINDFVAFLPEVSQEEQPLLCQAVDCTVLPSLFEMSSLTMWESLASRTSFIGTATGDAGTVISQIDARLILPDNQPGEIVKTLNYFFHLSAKERDQVGMRGQRLVHDHNPEAVAKKFMEFMKGLNENEKNTHFLNNEVFDC